METASVFFALLLSLACVDARNVFVQEDLGKSTKGGFLSSSEESKLPEFICLTCLEVSRKVEIVLTNPELPEKVMLYVHDACHILPPDLQNDCVETLEGFVQQVVMFLQVFFDEENLCNSTGLCSATADILSRPNLHKGQQSFAKELVYDLRSKIGRDSRLLTMMMSFSELQIHASKISGSRGCDACRKTMDDLHEDLEDPELKMKLLTVLMKACENAENHVKQCKRMVLEYGPLILSKLEKYLNSNDLCSMARICEVSAQDHGEFLSAS